ALVGDAWYPWNTPDPSGQRVGRPQILPPLLRQVGHQLRLRIPLMVHGAVNHRTAVRDVHNPIISAQPDELLESVAASRHRITTCRPTHLTYIEVAARVEAYAMRGIKGPRRTRLVRTPACPKRSIRSKDRYSRRRKVRWKRRLK